MACIFLAATLAAWLLMDVESGVLIGNGFTFPLSIGLLFLQAWLISGQTANQPIPVIVPCLGMVAMTSVFNRTIFMEQTSLYLVLAISCAIGLTLQLMLLETAPQRGTQRGGQSRRVILATFSVAALSTWLMTAFWSGLVVKAQSWLPELMVNSEWRQPIPIYVRSGRIGGVSWEQRTGPLNIALRVYSDQTPGYLRGRVFDHYANAEWTVIGSQAGGRRGRNKWDRLENKRLNRPLQQAPAGLTLPTGERNLFAIQPNGADSFRCLEVRNNPRRGEMFFTALHTSYLAGTGKLAATDVHQVLHSGIQSGEPYWFWIPNQASQQPLPDTLRQRALHLPADLDPQILELADALCREKTSSRQKIQAVTNYLRNNFEYQIETPSLPKGVEPLSHFLLKKCPANCEFFASAAAVLLRGAGVPSRYVTGYVVTEVENDDQAYYLAQSGCSRLGRSLR